MWYSCKGQFKPCKMIRNQAIDNAVVPRAVQTQCELRLQRIFKMASLESSFIIKSAGGLCDVLFPSK